MVTFVESLRTSTFGTMTVAVSFTMSGALNEGMSDIMGAVCEAWNAKAVSTKTWQIGEEIWTPATPNDAMRYMDNPTKD